MNRHLLPHLRKPTRAAAIRRTRIARRSSVLAAEHCLWCWCQGMAPSDAVAPFGRVSARVSDWGEASKVLAAAWRLAMWRSEARSVAA